MINIWDLLFFSFQQKVIFNPLEFISCGLVHEEAHRKYFEKHNMIGDDKDSIDFRENFYFEYEENAILEEIGFLKKAINIIPKMIRTRSFIIKSWSNTGLPDCEIIEIDVCPPIRLEYFYLLSRKNVLEQLRSLKSLNTPKKECEKRKVACGVSIFSELSSALKLEPPLISPIIEMPKL
jgi:hypothetical protein